MATIDWGMVGVNIMMKGKEGVIGNISMDGWMR